MQNQDNDIYAKFLIKGFDSIQESYNVLICEKWSEIFFNLKNEAERIEAPKTFLCGKYELQMLPTGATGFKFRIADEDVQLLIRNPAGAIKDWQVSVRYSSKGLWLKGFDEVEKKVIEILNIISIRLCEDWRRLTRADYCFDFYCPKFYGEMKPGIVEKIVAISRVKTNTVGTVLKEEKFADYGMAARVETLNIGTKNTLQIGVYDKTREITEVSGKTFFYNLWGEEYKNSVFRIEVRFFKDWLRAMHIVTMADLLNNLKDMVNTALISRRLSIPVKDTNRSRWPVHPLWQAALTSNDSDIVLPRLGKIVNLRPEALRNCYLGQSAGLLRNYCVSKYGEINDKGVTEYMQEMLNIFYADPLFKKKEYVVIERQQAIKERIK